MEFLKDFAYTNVYFNETIIGKFSQKPHFNIDVSKKKFPELNDEELIIWGNWILHKLILLLQKNITGIDINRDLGIYSLHEEDKINYHVIINGYYHENNLEAKAFYYKLLNCMIDFLNDENLSIILKKSFDQKVYNNNQIFRLLESKKYDTDKIKTQIINQSFKNLEYKYQRDEGEKLELYDFKFSLVSNINLAQKLPSFISESPVKFIKTTDDISFEMINYAVTTTNFWIGVCFQLNKINGRFVELKNVKCGYNCPICKSHHKNENPYILITEKYLYFYCGQAQNSKGGHCCLKVQDEEILEKYETDHVLMLDDQVYINGELAEIKNDEFDIISILEKNNIIFDKLNDDVLFGGNLLTKNIVLEPQKKKLKLTKKINNDNFECPIIHPFAFDDDRYNIHNLFGEVVKLSNEVKSANLRGEEPILVDEEQACKWLVENLSRVIRYASGDGTAIIKTNESKTTKFIVTDLKTFLSNNGKSHYLLYGDKGKLTLNKLFSTQWIRGLEVRGIVNQPVPEWDMKDWLYRNPNMINIFPGIKAKLILLEDLSKKDCENIEFILDHIKINIYNDNEELFLYFIMWYYTVIILLQKTKSAIFLYEKGGTGKSAIIT